ncbi:MAG: hypothetical protein E7582_03060 [Ruminococcaceae bacterium]|nr:hypothetical protein [Oscillospiraceae bacterium]
MFAINETKTGVIFENDKAIITLSKKSAMVEEIIDKKSRRDIRGEETSFFAVLDKDNECIESELSLKGDILTLDTTFGKVEIEAKIFDTYFTFELMGELPEGIEKLYLANASYKYDVTNKENTGANGIAMTYWVDPTYYPDAKSLKTCGRILRRLQSRGGKFALVIAPVCEMKEIIKKLSDTIDKNVGIVSHAGGAWGRDFELNYSSYSIQTTVSKEWLDKNLQLLSMTGADAIHFHHSPESFRQGDYKYTYFKDSKEFRDEVIPRLEKYGMYAGFHCYSFYISYESEPILSKSENLKQLLYFDTYTLKEDLDEKSDFIKVDEKEKVLVKERRATPFVVIGDELIRIEPTPEGFQVVQRGWAGSQVSCHKKGEKVNRVEGYYKCIASRPGSDLFFDIARRTAAAYNEGGYKTIYLDAFDGLHFHCDKEEKWYYAAAFVTEVLKYCDTPPVMEYSWSLPSIWAARGRYGAYDVAARGYKELNRQHAEDNEKFADRFGAGTLGWYDFYPQTLTTPGDTHVKYQHTDAIEHMGSLAIAYNYGNVFHVKPEYLTENAGMRRNITLYKKYDDLRRAKYFSQDVLEKIREGKWEYHLKEKRGKKFVFVEKDYQSRRLYDIFDPLYKTSKFKNPFGRQTPFVRIEPLLSTRGENPVTLIEFDEKKDLIEQNLRVDYEKPIDISKKMAHKVRIKGNGKKGGAICIKFHGKCFAEHIIDTDFRGWREFTLLESDNGERPDLPFDSEKYNSHFHGVVRYGFDYKKVNAVEILTEGDMTGVKMSSVVACDHVYDVLKNPTLKIGDKQVYFQCEITSSEFIEFNGKEAVVYDRYANKKNVYFEGDICVPKGKFKAEFSAVSLNNLEKPRAYITFGFTGKEVK